MQPFSQGRQLCVLLSAGFEQMAQQRQVRAREIEKKAISIWHGLSRRPLSLLGGMISMHGPISTGRCRRRTGWSHIMRLLINLQEQRFIFCEMELFLFLRNILHEELAGTVNPRTGWQNHVTDW